MINLEQCDLTDWEDNSVLRSKQLVMIVVIFCIWSALLAGCSALRSVQPQTVKETQFIMDTIMDITVYGPQPQSAIDAAFTEIKRIDALMNIYDVNSEASKVNVSAGSKPIAVSQDMITVLERSLQFSEMTDGVFDVTIGPLTTLWGIGKKGDYVPPADEIAKARSLVDYKKLTIDPAAKTVMLEKPGMMLDLGAVAKGYAVDRAIDILKQHGITSALVNAGGDIRVIGSRPNGEAWRIGIQHPRRSEEIAAKLALTDWDTLVTSGDYQRFFEKDGVRYHHILNPKTGRPAIESETISVTVGTTNSLDGDILSTVLFLLGPDAGNKLLSQLPQTDAIWITQDEKTHLSKGFQGKIELGTAGR